MKRINVNFGGGADTPLYSVIEQKFYSYEQDQDQLWDYGLENKYLSQSGLSGHGVLTNPRDLIKFGWYRTDASGQQYHEEVSPGILGYVPIASHQGLQINKHEPIVLTDGTNVVFCGPNEVSGEILNWEDQGKDMPPIIYYTPDGVEHKKEWTFRNNGNYCGLNAQRFVDLRHAITLMQSVKSGYSNLFEYKLSIKESNGIWLHDNGKYIDYVFHVDPLKIVGHVIDGWYADGDGFFYRREGNNVTAFAMKDRGKYVHPNLSKYIDYETQEGVFLFFSKTIEEWKKYFQSKILKKLRKDYVFVCKEERLKKNIIVEMGKNPRKVVTIQDSLDQGNCEYGTRQFLNRYGINGNTITISELVNHPKISEMVDNYHFRKVILAN